MSGIHKGRGERDKDIDESSDEGQMMMPSDEDAIPQQMPAVPLCV